MSERLQEKWTKVAPSDAVREIPSKQDSAEIFHFSAKVTVILNHENGKLRRSRCARLVHGASLRNFGEVPINVHACFSLFTNVHPDTSRGPISGPSKSLEVCLSCPAASSPPTSVNDSLNLLLRLSSWLSVEGFEIEEMRLL